jgi:hypothetical protein
MALELGKGMLLALHLGRLKDTGTLRPEPGQHSASSTACREAIAIARECRTHPRRGNGITLEYPVMRHANNLESVLTYEGTSEIHQLMIGAGPDRRARLSLTRRGQIPGCGLVRWLSEHGRYALERWRPHSGLEENLMLLDISESAADSDTRPLQSCRLR